MGSIRDSSWPLIAAAAAAGGVLYAAIKRKTAARGLPYPPGPPPSKIPLVGNMFDIPTEQEWVRFTELGKEYGPLVMLTIFGQRMCIINTAEAATELLTQRAHNYSERPNLVMVKELMGWRFNFGLRNASDPTWAPSRKNFARTLGPKGAAGYQDVQMHENARCLERMLDLDNAEDFNASIKTMTATVIMIIGFGYRPDSFEDPFVQAAEIAQVTMVNAARPGAYLVDAFSSLKYVPAWVPGAGTFHRVAEEGRRATEEMLEGAWSWAMDQYKRGVARPSFFKTLVDEHATGHSKQDLRAIQEDCALMYATGADTIISALLTFILAMLHAPEVQTKAREELDHVTGGTRLPTYADHDALPYVDAVMKEVLRWEQVSPLGVPHVSLADDVYKGYFIPAGTTIIANQWCMSHDEDTYPDPMAFKPERFLVDSKIRDPSTIAFGFGKRLCPGRFLARDTLWLYIATTLSCFEIKRAKDANGSEIVPPRTYTSGLSSRPLDFPYHLVPRPGWEAIIRESAMESD